MWISYRKQAHNKQLLNKNEYVCNIVESYHPKDAGGTLRATGMEDNVTWTTNKIENFRDKNVCSCTQWTALQEKMKTTKDSVVVFLKR